MAEEKLYFTFEQDTKSFIHQINELLIRLENSGYNKDVINQIFRCIHSIKSEAAYLKLDEIAEAAHEMETAIEPLRTEAGEVSLDSGLLEFCFSIIDGISARLENIKIPRNVDGPVNETGSDEEVLQDLRSGYYNDFELLLIKEARSRGERLIRLSFGVAEDESMKYPRAYLALSNLEINHNVINVKPELEDAGDISWDRITVTVSSSSTDKEIADEINIDQIENIEISDLSYEEELRNLPEEGDNQPSQAEESSQRVISVEASEINAISEYVTEIKTRLADLTAVINNGDTREKFESDLLGLETISSGIEKMMTNLQTVDFNTHFAGYRRTARDLAARLEKKVEIDFDGRNIKMLRDFADFIAEPLLQLIRNAVVHGIEPVQKRLESGKNETGMIRIRAEKNEQAVTVTVEDDGAGVVVDSDADGDLLSIISSPGFSTHDESADYAGRGVGLDLVKNRILRRSGKLELVNRPGEGCSFKMIFTENKGEVPFLVIRTGDTTCAVKIDPDAVVFSISAEEISLVEGDYYYDGELLFNHDGRLKTLGDNKIFQGLRMSYLGNTGILVFDESMFEVKYSSSAVTEGFDIGSYCRELIINDKPAEYSLLTPQVLFD